MAFASSNLAPGDLCDKMPKASKKIIIRPYKPSDYPALEALYKRKQTYGGTFSKYRDSKGTLAKITSRDTYAVIVAEINGKVTGTLSLIENERVAWFYRFCVADSAFSDEVSEKLCQKASAVLSKRGHKEVLVYSDPGSSKLNSRYSKLGFKKGGKYVCYSKSLKAI